MTASTIFWVAQNGDDTNAGDHPNGPFKTLKHALDVVDASTQGPVTIHVMPGGYEEELPLVVPSNVTIRGEDFRNTIIRPTSADSPLLFKAILALIFSLSLNRTCRYSFVLRNRTCEKC